MRKFFDFCIIFLLSISLADAIYAAGEKDAGEKPAGAALISSKPVQAVKFGGKLDVRYEDPESKTGTFKMYEFEPFVEVDINENICMKGQVGNCTDKIEVRDTWVQYKGIPVINGSMKVGKFRWKSFGLPQGDERVSVDYALLGREFTGDRQVGLEYCRSFNIVNLGIGMFNGAQIGDREAGDTDTTLATPAKFVADRSGDTDTNQNKDIAARVTVEPVKGFQISGSFLTGKLSSADITKLNGYIATTYISDKKQRFGGDITYRNSMLEIRAEYMQGKTSDLETNSWYTMGIVKDILNKLDIYSRYSQLIPDIALDVTKSCTWSLYQTTTGVIWNFNKMAQLQVEYEFNREGIPDRLDNDILRVRLLTRF